MPEKSKIELSRDLLEINREIARLCNKSCLLSARQEKELKKLFVQKRKIIAAITRNDFDEYY